MHKIKITIFFFIFSTFSLHLLGQYSNNQGNADSSAYYPRYWNRAMDNLNKMWMATQLVNSAEESHNKTTSQELNKPSNSQKILKDLEIEYTPRAKEIYSNFKSSLPKSRVGLALYKKHQETFTKTCDSMGLPSVFNRLPFALSAMNNKARNYLGGAGYWQIPYTYGKKYGLQIDSYVDERLDAKKATIAAAKILKSFYAIYGDWKLTLAAYTCGPSNVNKAIRRNGDQVDFYAIKASLPYFGRDVVDALAASIVFFGEINFPSNLKYNPVLDTIEVSKRLHFQQIADLMDLNMDEIRFLNPIYKYDIVPAINKVYYLYLPQGSLKAFNEIEDSIYHYKDSILFNLHKRVILPRHPKVGIGQLQLKKRFPRIV